MDGTVESLRQRAAQLRAVAARLTETPLHGLAAYAGTDTWRGPAADEFRTAVAIYRGDASTAAADLRWQASQLDEQATQREAQLFAEQAAAG